MKKLEGAWVVVSHERDGEQVPIENFKDYKMIIKDGKMFLIREHDTGGQGLTFSIDASKKLKTIDTKAPAGSASDKTSGIYELVGDNMLKICDSFPGEKRPTEFKTMPQSKRFFTVFNREGPSMPLPQPMGAAQYKAKTVVIGGQNITQYELAGPNPLPPAAQPAPPHAPLPITPQIGPDDAVEYRPPPGKEATIKVGDIELKPLKRQGIVEIDEQGRINIGDFQLFSIKGQQPTIKMGEIEYYFPISRKKIRIRLGEQDKAKP